MQRYSEKVTTPHWQCVLVLAVASFLQVFSEGHQHDALAQLQVQRAQLHAGPSHVVQRSPGVPALA
jgi:hypothetical protein